MINSDTHYLTFFFFKLYLLESDKRWMFLKEISRNITFVTTFTTIYSYCEWWNTDSGSIIPLFTNCKKVMMLTLYIFNKKLFHTSFVNMCEK